MALPQQPGLAGLSVPKRANVRHSSFCRYGHARRTGASRREKAALSLPEVAAALKNVLASPAAGTMLRRAMQVHDSYAMPVHMYGSSELEHGRTFL